MKLLASILIAMVFALAGCTESPSGGKSQPVTTVAGGFKLPAGDPVKGKATFAAMQCFHCHAVPGEDFAAPVATPPVAVPLGANVSAQSAEQLAQSIIAPSHNIPDNLSSAEGSRLSRMGDFSHAMTVRELIDMVAYLKTLKGR